VLSKAVAWPNNDLLLLAWRYPGRYRTALGSRGKVSAPDARFAALPSYVGWEAKLGAAERTRLTGELQQTLLTFIERATKKRRILAALYELIDDRLALRALSKGRRAV
jgi:hypothetical protein